MRTTGLLRGSADIVFEHDNTYTLCGAGNSITKSITPHSKRVNTNHHRHTSSPPPLAPSAHLLRQALSDHNTPLATPTHILTHLLLLLRLQLPHHLLTLPFIRLKRLPLRIDFLLRQSG